MDYKELLEHILFTKITDDYTDEDSYCPSCGQAIDWSR